MLQPRIPFFRPALCQRCIHTISRRLLPQIQQPQDDGYVFNAELGIGYRPDDIDVTDNDVKLRRYKPRTPSLRHLARPINDHLYKGRAYLPLTFARKGQHLGGRNRTGQVTVRHRGGGVKRRIRTVDFQRMTPGKHLVERIEHDPGRSAHLALVSIQQGEEKQYSYIVAPHGLRAGETVESFRAGLPDDLKREAGASGGGAGLLAVKTIVRGNCMPLSMIPPGSSVYCVGFKRNGPAQFCRGAGTYAQIISTNEGDPKWQDFINVKLKSGEVRRIHKDCCATIGIASNINYNRRNLGKAGRARWLGIRPTVRGMAMNAVDHPHGGGRGKTRGNKPQMSPWGQLTKAGFKTRKKSNVNRYVMTARPRMVGKRAAKRMKKKRENQAAKSKKKQKKKN